MGEAYKGLTIKIGADSTELTKVLQNVTAAARATQAQLRKIETGLRFDPSNAVLLATKVQTLGDRMQSLGMRATLIRESLDNISDAAMKKLADSTYNVALRAEMALQQYNRIDNEIAIVRNKLHGFAEEAGLKDLVREKDVDVIIDGLRSSSEAMAKHGEEVKALANQYDGLVDRWHEADKELSFTKEVRDARNYAIEVENIRAEYRKLAGDLVKVEAQNKLLNIAGFRDLTAQIERSKDAANELKSELDRIEQSIELNPKDFQALVMRASSLRDAISVANGELVETRAKLKALEDSKALEGASNDAQALAKRLRETEAAASDAKAGLMEVKGELEAVRQKERDLSEQTKRGVISKEDLDEAQKELREVRVEAARLESEMADLERKSEAASEAYETARAQSEARELRVRIVELEAAVANLTERERQNLVVTREMLNGFRSAGMTLSATLTAGMTMAGRRLMDEAKEIDSAYRDMRKTVDGTEEQFEALRQSALDFSLTHVTSAQTMLEMQSLGGQMGIAVDKLEEFGRIASNLDIATNMDAEDIALNLGQLQNVMHMGEGDMEGFSNALVRLGNNMPAQESAIMNVTTRIASMGTIVGMSQDEILGWATAIAATGQKSESAATAISRTMSNIESAVASGGDAVEGFASVAGMSAEKFATTWRNNPSLAMQQFVGGLRQIQDQGGSVDATLQQLGITGVRQKQALMGLTQTYTILGDALSMSRHAFYGIEDEFGAAGDAAREADLKSQGFSGTMSMLSNSIGVLGDAFGTAILPVMNSLVGLVQNVTAAFKNASPAVQGLVIVAGAFTAGLGPMMAGLSSVVRVTSDMSDFLKRASAALMAYNAALQAGEASEAALATGMGKTTGALGDLIKRLTIAISQKYGAAAANSVLAVSEKVAEGATRALTVALVALPLISVIAGIASLIGMVASFADEMRKAARAQDPLLSALDEIDARSKSAIENGEKFNETYSGEIGPDVKFSALKAEFEELSSLESLTITQEMRLSAVRRELAGYSQELADAFEDEGDAAAQIAALEVEAERQQEQRERQRYVDALVGRAEVMQAIDEERRVIEQQEAAARGASMFDSNGFDADAIRRSRENIRQLEQQYDSYTETIESYNSAKAEQYKMDQAVKDYQAGITDEAHFRLVYDLNIEDVEAASKQAMDDLAQEAAEAYEEVMSTVQGVFNTIPGLADAVSSMGFDVSGFTAALTLAGVSMDDFVTRVQSNAQKTIDAFNLIQTNEENTLENGIRTLWANQEAMAQWGNNMAALRSMGLENSEALFSQLMKGGVENYGIFLQQMLDQGGAWVDGVFYTIQQVADLFANGWKLAVQVTAQELNMLPEVVQPFIDGMSAALSSGTGAMIGDMQFTADQLYTLLNEGVATAVDGTTVTLENAIALWGAAMQDATTAAAEGVEQTTGEVTAATESMAQQGADAAGGKSGEYGEAGTQSGDAFTEGLAESMSPAVDAAQDTADGVDAALASASSNAFTYGMNVGEGLANGIRSKMGEVWSASFDLANMAKAGTTTPLEIRSPSRVMERVGGWFSEGFAIGIAKETAEVVASAANMAKQALEAVDLDPSYFANTAGDAAYAANAARTRALGAAYSTNSTANTTNLYVDGRLLNMTPRMEEAVWTVLGEAEGYGEM